MSAFIEKYSSEIIKKVQEEYLNLLGLDYNSKEEFYSVFHSKNSLELNNTGLRIFKSSNKLEMHQTMFDKRLKWNSLKDILNASEKPMPYYLAKDGKTFYTCDKNLYYICKLLGGENLSKNF